jgi:hypothetical protein
MSRPRVVIAEGCLDSQSFSQRNKATSGDGITLGSSGPLKSAAAQSQVVMRRWAPEGRRSILQSMPQLASELGHARPHIRPKPCWIRVNWKRW